MKEKRPRYGIFIIESMDIKNEIDKKLDGFALKTILDLCDIPNKYFYIRTKLELEKVIKLFNKSNYGFLHLACHGTESGIELTFDTITFDELELIIGGNLYHRRLFLSACKVARFELAEHFIPKYHCYSIIGSPDKIAYDKAAVFWSSFYYQIYQLNKFHMPQSNLCPILENVTKAFNIKINYFSIIRNDSPRSMQHLREFHYDSGVPKYDMVKETRFKNIYRL